MRLNWAWEFSAQVAWPFACLAYPPEPSGPFGNYYTSPVSRERNRRPAMSIGNPDISASAPFEVLLTRVRENKESTSRNSAAVGESGFGKVLTFQGQMRPSRFSRERFVAPPGILHGANVGCINRLPAMVVAVCRCHSSLPDESRWRDVAMHDFQVERRSFSAVCDFVGELHFGRVSLAIFGEDLTAFSAFLDCRDF